MKKFSLIFLASCLFSLVSYSQTPQPTPPVVESEIIRIDSNLVKLDFIVLDKNDNPVSNLTIDDIEVYQDGKKQNLSGFSFQQDEKKTVEESDKKRQKTKDAAPVPPSFGRSRENGRLLTFVVDDGNCKTSLTGINNAKKTLVKFINEQMLPNDKIAIYQTKPGSSLLRQYTSNKEQLLRQVSKINPTIIGLYCGASVFDAVAVNQTFANLEIKDEILDSSQGAKTIGSIGVLNHVIERLKPIAGRKIVFYLSEGLFVPPQTQGFDIFKAMSDKALRSSVVFYTLDVRGLINQSMVEAADVVEGIGNEGGESQTEKVIIEPRVRELRDSRSGLADLAYSTGGDFIYDQNSLNYGIEKVINKESGYYLVSYEPQEFSGKDFHQIEIKSKRKDLKVVSRAGFYGIKEKPKKTLQKNAESPLFQAIASPFAEDGIEMRMTTIYENDATKGSYLRILLHLNGKDLTFVDLPNGKKKLSLDVVAVTLNENDKVVDEFNRTHTVQIESESLSFIRENGLIYSADVPLKKKGAYNLRMVVRDNAGNKLGSVSDVVEVRTADTEKFFMSGLITAEIGQDGKIIFPVGKTAENAISLSLNSTNSAIRRYRPGDKLNYAFSLYNAKNELTSQIRLFSQGKLIVEGKESPLSVKDIKKQQNFGVFQITPQAPLGEFVLQIVVRDKKTKQIVSQWIDFEVVKP